MPFFQIAQKVAQYLGHVCKIIFHQDFSKVAQSGHTGGDKQSDCPTQKAAHRPWSQKFFFFACASVLKLSYNCSSPLSTM